jgi:hypothetical protein
MKFIPTKISTFRLPWWSAPILLVIVGILAYGLLFRQLGFYWDDWVFIWMARTTGSEGLTRYFSTNRPFWGETIKFTTTLLGSNPWQWQLFGLFWRLAAAISLWGFALLLWPRQYRAALWVSLLFLVYPGFSMQFIAINMGHFFLVLTAFLLSLCFTVLALSGKRGSWLLHFPALLLAAVNLLAMEYFYLLELLRPVVIWIALSRRISNPRQLLWKTFLFSLPYLVLFLGVTYWRFYIFPYQTRYPLTLLADLKASPLSALMKYLSVVALSLWTVLIPGWVQAFHIPDIHSLGRITSIFTGLLILFSVILIGAFVWRSSRSEEEKTGSSHWPGQFLLLGGLILVLGGIPFWLTGLPIQLGFPTNRFIIPSIPGAAFLLAGLLGFLARLPGRWHRLPDILLVVLVAFSIGWQFQVANDFRRDWDLQKRFFQQLSQRIPALQRGTLLLAGDLPSGYVSDNSVTAPINWIYDPGYKGGDLPYLLYYPSVRLGSVLPSLNKGVRIEQDYLVSSFSGNTSQAVALYYAPPACLKILDPQVDSVNQTLPVVMRSAARLSDRSRIINSKQATPVSDFFGQEPFPEWCSYFEQADLAAQNRDWAQVVSLAEKAFALGDTPADPIERFPYIEGFANTGDWSRALELTRDSADVTPLIHPSLCAIWGRIKSQTPNSQEKTAVLGQVSSIVEDCLFP